MPNPADEDYAEDNLAERLEEVRRQEAAALEQLLAEHGENAKEAMDLGPDDEEFEAHLANKKKGLLFDSDILEDAAL